MDPELESLLNRQNKIIRRYALLAKLRFICQISLLVCAIPLVAFITLRIKGILPFPPLYLFALSLVAFFLAFCAPILEILKEIALKKYQKINLQILSRLKSPLSY
jgi:hypothetical protein